MNSTVTKLTLATLLVIVSATSASFAQQRGITIVKNEAAQRVDVLIDGQPFTSYIWSDKLKVPVLYPLRTATGTIVTRGFPLEPRPGERVDHPHHIGLWFNYGSVNGVDFWNNSVALSPEQQKKMGMVAHRRVVKSTGGKDRGELVVEMDWIMPDGQPILHETTTFIFRSGLNSRTVDRIVITSAGMSFCGITSARSNSSSNLVRYSRLASLSRSRAISIKRVSRSLSG